MTTKLGIIGGGVVGSALALSYENKKLGNCVVIWDVNPVRRNIDSLWNLKDIDLLMICLPTPQSKNGFAADISAIEDFLTEFLKIVEKPPQIVLRSTVPIGTTSYLNKKYELDMVYSPEFLREKTALEDAQHPTRHIIGGKSEILRNFYLERFPEVPIFECSTSEAEAVKLFTNTFLATKVSLFNEFRELSDQLGLAWHKVRYGILTDPRINYSHTQIPGETGYGFLSNCLNKDLCNLIDCFRHFGVNSPILEAVHNRNLKDTQK